MNSVINDGLTERQRIWAAIQRLNTLSDLLVNKICDRIRTRTNLNELDSLFDRSSRAHDLFRRLHARYEATTPDDLKRLLPEFYPEFHKGQSNNE